jgi:uncharacterized cupredoxin-like copper-binding protein
MRAPLCVVLAAAALVGCGSDDDESADLPPVEGPTSPRLEVTATEMMYDPSAVAVEAGEVEVVLHNEGGLLHDIRIGDEPIALEANPGDTATEQIPLEAGSYEFFCSLPGHREAGMEGVLEVRAP